MVVRVATEGSYEPVVVEAIALVGNVKYMSIQFKMAENEEFTTSEGYRMIAADEGRVELNPAVEALYVKVILDEAAPADNGAIPQYYQTTLSIYGCFHCGRLNRVYVIQIKVLWFPHFRTSNMAFMKKIACFVVHSLSIIWPLWYK